MQNYESIRLVKMFESTIYPNLNRVSHLLKILYNKKLSQIKKNIVLRIAILIWR